MSQGLRQPESNRENYPDSQQSMTDKYKAPEVPTGLDDILGEIDAAVGNSNLSEQYRQRGGQ